MNILREILSSKREFLKARKQELPLKKLRSLLPSELARPRFRSSIASPGIHLIAEIKKASPSAGIIRKVFNLAAIACAYEEAGASCLSVLTDEKFFKGNLFYLQQLQTLTALPLLRKDFIIDEYQIIESKVYGADAVLLIAAILDEQKIKKFVRLAKELRLDVVLEIHSDKDLAKALVSDVGTIGINTRDLDDFSLDLEILPKLLKKIPKGKLVICESGIKNLSDLRFVKNFKVNAVLVGEALMRSKNIAARTKGFLDFLKK